MSSRFRYGNRVKLLFNGTQYFPALEKACNAAQQEIYLQTYIFQEDATGNSVAAALSRAARRGVSVYLLIDGFGSKDVRPGFLEEMRDAGVQVLKYRPQISPWTLQRERLRRLHCKIAVVDAAVAFVGGINIIDDMDTPRQIPPRFDYAVRVEGPILADIYPVVTRVWLLSRWSQMGRRRRRRTPVTVRMQRCGNQRAAFVIRDNFRHRKDIENAYLDAISHAKHEIVIANAYFFPGQNFRHALTAASARGVRVVLLLQGKIEYLLLYYAAQALYRSFLKAGIEIYEYRRSFLHAKVAVIDSMWATVGSSNIDPMSLLLAREANVVLKDAGFARKLHVTLLEAIEKGAQRVQLEVWQKQSLPTRIMTWVCYELVRFLTGWSSYGRAREFK